ncbi:hypothetical protein [Nonomuraea sp. NPDC050691]|uniref:hypothetical protein n=1 Tax=Nonomuraea sp. NPDC050691 TaxID=3155661 RepID=UPI00341041AF
MAAFAAAWQGPLDILVNNAARHRVPLTRTPDGWELHFPTDHLGHFALTTALHPALAAVGDTRVVAVSSSQHWLSRSPSTTSTSSGALRREHGGLRAEGRAGAHRP